MSNHVVSCSIPTACVHQAADHCRKVGEKLLQDHIDLWRLSARHAFGRSEGRVSWRELRRRYPRQPSEPTREQWEARIQDISVPRMWVNNAQNILKCWKDALTCIMPCKSDSLLEIASCSIHISSYIKVSKRLGCQSAITWPWLFDCDPKAAEFHRWISASSAFLWNQFFLHINTSLSSS